jgi:F-box and WD-40 domain protein CDC4
MLRVLHGHQESVRCLDVCGNKVVSGSYDTTLRVSFLYLSVEIKYADRIVLAKLWNVDTGECLHVMRGHFHQIYSVAFDGVHIASGGLDTTVRVWNAKTGYVVRSS